MPLRFVSSLVLVVVATIASPAAVAEDAKTWSAGIARTRITPRQPMPMAGYASRGAKHAEGTLTELWAKALALEAGENRAVLVTLDLIGMDAALADRIYEQAHEKFGLDRGQLMLATSHTHTGPVVAGNLRPMHELMFSEEDLQLVRSNSDFIAQSVLQVVEQSLADLKPAELFWGSGRATFAVNRRENREADVPTLREAGELKGPVDHDVPVLAILRSTKLEALVFGYACHATTLASFEWSGDYPAFAQQELEERHPGVTAMFWAGCGGDQNPLPRRTVELAREYGKTLADSVDAALEAGLRTVQPRLATTHGTTPLEFAHIPDADELRAETESSNKYVATRASALLKLLESGQQIRTSYPYPIAVWQLGQDLRWVFLGGEVTVDYAIRLKAELGSDPLGHTDLWVTAYSNDVMAYIPSRRVLGEGGYEGGGAMIYYGLPSPWAETVEERIIEQTHRLTQTLTDSSSRPDASSR